jgi:hypothetical protein
MENNMDYLIAILIIGALGWYIWRRLARSNVDPVTVANAEKRLGAKAALQFAIDNGLPLKTSVGETDGFNVWNATNVSGLRVPGDLSGGTR